MTDKNSKDLRDMIAKHMKERGVEKCPPGRALGAELCGTMSPEDRAESDKYVPHDERLVGETYPWSNWMNKFSISPAEDIQKPTAEEGNAGRPTSEIYITPKLGRGFETFFDPEAIDD